MSPKKGFVYSSKDDTAPMKIYSLKPSWYYNWGPKPTVGIEDIPFTPMIWSAKNAKDKSLVNSFISYNKQELLGFNEPDRADQSNMTVDEAIDLWSGLVNTRRRIGSPATSSNATVAGGWFDLFMQRNPKVDFIAIHWYASPKPDSLLNIVDTLHSKYNLPIWITEFAVADWKIPNKYTTNQVADFMKQIIPELEKREYVEKYSWKTRTISDPNMGSSSLFYDDGSLTDLGKLYSTF